VKARRVLALLSALTIASAGFAQTAAAASASPDASMSPVGGEVTWWVSLSDDAIAELNEVFVKPLKAEYPDIDFKFQSKGDALQDTLRTSLQGGAGPDIIAVPNPAAVPPYVTASLLEPLDDYATQYGWKDKIASWAYDTGVVQDNLYALPGTFDAYGIMYNKKVFEDNGLAFPTNMEELQSAGQTLMDNGVAPFANGAKYISFFTAPLLGAIAGPDTVYQASTGAIPWTDPQLMDAMSQMVDWIQAGWFRGSPDAFLAGDEFGGYTLLAQGKAAMYLIGAWSFDSMAKAFADNPDDWDWAEVPGLASGVTASYPIGVGGSYAINAASESKDAAAAVLDFYYSNPQIIGSMMGYSDLADMASVPITNLTAEDLPTTLDPRRINELADLSAEMAANNFGYAGFQGPLQAEVYQTDFATVIQGGMTLAEWGEKLDAAYQADVAAGNQPAVPPR
jgi:raffinose/stachyose/melibiose transport system substrate-binding protein